MDIRGKLLVWTFENTQRPYARLFKRKLTPWGLTTEALMNFPEGSLGHALGHHLAGQGFELIDRHESHDVFHLIAGIGSAAVNEVELQFWLHGNGKRSLYLFLAMIAGSVLFPECWGCFQRAHRRGGQHHAVWNQDLRARLHLPLEVATWPTPMSTTNEQWDAQPTQATNLRLAAHPV